MKSRKATVLWFLCLVWVSGTLGQSSGKKRDGSSKNPDRGSQLTNVNEKEALLKFKRTLKDPTGILKGWTKNSDPCREVWPGIECSPTRHIQAINLPNFALEGTLPDFGVLIALQSFRMPNNRLTGSLPEKWHALSLLDTIDLRGNNITGTLPESWSDAHSLKYLYLNGNQIEGILPQVWWLGNFNTLALAGNRIGGTLPVNWANMPLIEILDLSNNQLTGILPRNWRTLEHLKVLHLSGNAFFGPLPESWGELRSMTDLRIDNNNLVGELPSRWSFLLNTVTMLLNDNNLGGFVPEKWTALSQTCRIDLSNNPFICNFPPSGALIAKGEGPGLVIVGTNSGICPSLSSLDTQALLQFKSEIIIGSNENVLEDWEWKGNSACADGWRGIQCENGRVVGLDLSSRGLFGYLSAKLSEMSALRTLKLDGNAFDGVLPGKWGNIKTLRHLNISRNSIGGVLPVEWESLKELEVLDISHNRLLGELPSRWSRLRNLKVFKGFNNTLNGQLPFSWSSMRSIKHIQLQNNILTGALPSTWDRFGRVEAIDLSSNNLIGPVPSSWKKMKKLQLLNLQGNDALCGGIPSSLPSQTGPVSEALSTPCPDFVTESIHLVTFRYKVEDPTQSLALWKAEAPSCLPNYETWPGISCEDGRIVAIDLSNLRLAGVLPDTFAELSMLKGIHLDGNRFRGSLPSSWGELFRLEDLNVSSNALKGTLPMEWETMVSLVTMDLSGNAFEGSMPSEWSRMAKLEELHVSDNTKLCGGVAKELSKKVSVISNNSTFLESCGSSGPSWTIPIVSVLLSIFIFLSLSIWIACFCCCCYQRKKQRGRLLEMMSTSLSKSREAQNREIHAAGTLDALTDNVASTSGRTSHSGSRRSPDYRFAASYEVPPHPSQAASKAIHPYLPAAPWFPVHNTIHAIRPQEQNGRASSSRSPIPVAGRSLSQNANVSTRGGSPNRQPSAFGSMQSLPVTGSHDSSNARTPQSPPASTFPRSRSQMEMTRQSMVPPATPEDLQPTVQKIRPQSAAKHRPVDPRTLASKIPRAPTPSSVDSIKTGSSTNRSETRTGPQSDRSVHSVSSPSSSHRPRSARCRFDSQRSPAARILRPSTSAEPSGRRKQTVSWQYETTVEIPTPAEGRSSPTTEMFSWLESFYHSGTFDLEEVPPELISKAVQYRLPGTAAVDRVISSERQAKLSSATSSGSQGLQSTTKDLLMWVETRIAEQKESELNRARKSPPARLRWADANDIPLFNYKTSSTINDEQ